MISRFSRYVDKVFSLPAHLSHIKDSRVKHSIPPADCWLTVFFIFVFRIRSLNAAETNLCASEYVLNITGNTKISVDTLARVFSLMDPGPLRDILSKVNHKLKRNKVLRTNRFMRFVAVDGHELFSSRSHKCPGCLTRKITVNNQDVTERYHRIVACHLIGFEISIPLDIEPILPGEGEVKAAQRLIERVIENYARFFDCVLGDALYMEAPFINFCLKHKKHMIAVLKNNCSALLKDAKGLFENTQPTHEYQENNLKVRMWDVEGFDTLENASTKLRVLYSHEVEEKTIKKSGELKRVTVEHHRVWATTSPKSLLSSEAFRWAARHRWDIENKLFNTLVTHWHMNHCFRHHPNAIVNFLLTMLVSFVLVQSFYHLNLKAQARHKYTLIAVTTLLFVGLASCDITLLWLEGLPAP